MDQETIINRSDENISKYLQLILNENQNRVFSENQIEQIIFRVYLCNKCLVNKKCNFCKCNPLDVLPEPYSCNQKKVFPDLMSKENWINFKNENKIIIT